MAKASIAGEPTYVLELSRIEAQAIADLTACVDSRTSHGKASIRVYEALESAGFHYRDSVMDAVDSSVLIEALAIKDDA